jgi:2-hydroxychromene-2-carboxylate isomerase
MLGAKASGDAMAADLEFWFDFSSPYGYIASTKIDALAARHGRQVHWKPWLIGAIYKKYGYAPLEMPEKKAYFFKDVVRHAGFEGVALAIPPSFPEGLLAPSRALYWIEDQQGRAAAAAFGKAAYAAYWVEGRKLADPDVVAELAGSFGVDRAAARAALDDPSVKERLKRETEGAMAKGVFGSPFVIVDGEPFWGSDRLGEIDRFLAGPKPV